MQRVQKVISLNNYIIQDKFVNIRHLSNTNKNLFFDLFYALFILFFVVLIETYVSKADDAEMQHMKILREILRYTLRIEKSTEWSVEYVKNCFNHQCNKNPTNLWGYLQELYYTINISVARLEVIIHNKL